MNVNIEGLNFKFRYVQEGNVQSFFNKKAQVTTQEILLGDERLIYDDITYCICRDNRLIIGIHPQASLSYNLRNVLVDDCALILQIAQGNALALKRWIDQYLSRRQIEQRKRELVANQQSNLFYSLSCPHCQAVVDLSNLNRTTYVYCNYCESIFNQGSTLINSGENYCLCEDCGMFDRVQGYTEFYFYFLIAFYGFYYKKRYLCTNCVDGVFWKMLGLNFIFIIGIFPSIWLKLKSLSGRDPTLKSLKKANRLAKKGNYQKASLHYKQCYQNYPEHPGLLMNEALGHLYGQDGEGASILLDRARQSCSNYYPVSELLARLNSVFNSN